MVSVKRKVTTQTMIDMIRQFEFLSCSASRTSLTCISGVDLNHSFISVFCFIFEKIEKHSPCCISNALVNTFKIIFLHIVNRKIFNTYGIILINKFTRKLMAKIISFVGHSFVYSSNHFTSFCSGFRSFLLNGKFSLCPGKNPFFMSKKPRVHNMFAIGKRCEMLKPHVDSDDWFNGFFGRTMINVTGKRYKPFASRGTFNGAGLDYALDRFVKLYLNAPDFGKLNYILEKFKASLRISEGIISKLSSESWIPRLAAGFDTSEESPKSKVDSHRNILKNLAVNIGQKRMFLFKNFKRIALLISGKTFLFSFPCVLALLKQMIIKPATAIERLLKNCDLFMRREYPISKCLSHIYTIYIVLLNINNYFKKWQFIPGESPQGILVKLAGK